jgi:MFS family permease
MDLDLKSEKPLSTASSDQDVIDFQQPDPDDPRQWSQAKKMAIIINVSLLAAVGQMSSSMLAPAVPQILREFGESTSEELGAFVVSSYLLGMTLGLFILPGLSEIYGRAIVFWLSNVFFIGFAVGMAKSTSLGTLIGFRILLGLAASAPQSIDGGVVGDLFPPQERGRAASVYVLGIMMGPTIGPVAGGYLAGAKGWRWVCWLICIMVSFSASSLNFS